MNDDQMIHAYVDGELTQQEEQRVEQRLAEDEELRARVDAYRRIGDTIRRVRFKEPDRERWHDIETPPGAHRTRLLGLLLLLVGYFGLIGIALHDYFTGDDPLWGKVCVGAVLAGLGLLGASVARQRLLELPTDRYTRVQR